MGDSGTAKKTGPKAALSAFLLALRLRVLGHKKRSKILKSLTWGALLLLHPLWNSGTEAADVKLYWTWPLYEAQGGSDSLSCLPADTSKIETLSRGDLYMYSVPGRDTTFAGSIPGAGKGGMPDSVTISVADSVCYFVAYMYVFDQAGNRSCKSNEWLQAIEKKERVPGLLAKYYDDRLLTTFHSERVDSTIDFDWNLLAPIPSMGVETFSIRWEGILRISTGGPYTFEMTVEDGFRAWVGQTFTDDWGIANEHVKVWSVNLPADTDVPFRLEFTANNGTAVAQLRWIHPGATKQIVPASAFWH